MIQPDCINITIILFIYYLFTCGSQINWLGPYYLSNSAFPRHLASGRDRCFLSTQWGRRDGGLSNRTNSLPKRLITENPFLFYFLFNKGLCLGKNQYFTWYFDKLLNMLNWKQNWKSVLANPWSRPNFFPRFHNQKFIEYFW